MEKKIYLKTWVKVLLIAIAVIAAIVCFLIFAFKIKTVEYSSDINQFTKEEVQAYIKSQDINNSFMFWLKSKMGNQEKLALFEDYEVSLESLTKVKITAHEKQVKGYFKEDSKLHYFDSKGLYLKTIDTNVEEKTEPFKNKPKIDGLEIRKLKLYSKIETNDNDMFEGALKVCKSVGEYEYNVKKVKVVSNKEINMYVKKIEVELGRVNSDLNDKLRGFNDMYKKLKNKKGTLDMKTVKSDREYILKPTKNN